MAGRTEHLWKWRDMALNGWKLLEVLEIAGNGQKFMK